MTEDKQIYSDYQIFLTKNSVKCSTLNVCEVRVKISGLQSILQVDDIVHPT